MTYPTQNLKILVAEDHFPVRQLIASAIRSRNVALIDAATDGKKARDMIEQALQEGAPYDIVFLDWEMPAMAGIDVLKHFRAKPECGTTAFVMVTSISLQGNVLDAIKSGATAYMVKPVAPTAIIKKFDEILVWLAQKRAPAA
jgi:CheY-like chemotaxis protein